VEHKVESATLAVKNSLKILEEALEAALEMAAEEEEEVEKVEMTEAIESLNFLAQNLKNKP